MVGVNPNGPAATHDFRTGDVILQVGNKTVSDAGDNGKHNVLMRVKNATGIRFVAMPLGKA